MMNKITMRLALIGVVFVFVLFWIPTPYVIISPGSAEPVHSMVKIEEGYAEENGSLMLTTVRMTYSNAAAYIQSFFKPYADIRLKEELFREGESREEYSQRQQINMVASQINAIQAAYLKAGIPYELKTELLISDTVEGMPAEGVLEAGDSILRIDNEVVETSTDLIEMLEQRTIGDKVKITYLRAGSEKTVEIQIGETEEAKPAIGVYIINFQSVQTIETEKQVQITAGDIGGPSAGLIFALEIYNRLVPEDITKGYQIAGTGEITSDGLVGKIGGIQYKIVAAHRAGAEIFFTPEGNAQVANEQATSIETDMKVVAVKTMDDALAYLAALPPK